MEMETDMENTNKSTYIKHYREIPDWLKQSPICFHLLAEFARRARREAGEIAWSGEAIQLEPKQFITGRISVTGLLGMSEGEYRGACKKLARHGYIKTIKVTNRYSIYLYCADGIFSINASNDSPAETPPNLPTANHQLTTNKNENNDNNSTIVVKKQPSAVNKNIPVREEVNRGRGNPTAIGVTIGSNFSHLIGRSEVGEGENVPHYEWQVEAERLSKYVGITNPSKSWFKFFRESFANNRKFLLQRAASVMVDAPNVEDKEKYFFGLVYKFLKEA